MKVESVHLNVVVFEDATKDLPAWRDTIMVEITTPTITGSTMSSLRSQAIAAAMARHSSWADSILHPVPPPEVIPPTPGELMVIARDAMENIAQQQQDLQVAVDALTQAVAPVPEG